MALNFQTIELPLFGGLDTKTDDKSVQAGKALQLDNGVMQRTGSIQKRQGYEELPLGTTNAVGLLADDELEKGNSVHTYKDQLVMVGTDGLSFGRPGTHYGPHIFSKGESFDKWMTVGNYLPVTFDVDRISRPDGEHRNPSIAEGGGFRCVVYEYSTSPHVLADLVDINSGVTYRERLTINNVAEKPQVVYIEDSYGGNFLCLGMATTSSGTRTIDGRYLDITEPAEQGTSVTIAGTETLHPFQLWDMDRLEFPSHVVGDAEEDLLAEGETIDGYHQAIIVWKRGSDDKLQMVTTNGHGNIQKSRILEINAKNAVCVKYINDPRGNGERIFLLYQDNATGNVDAYGYDMALNEVIPKTTISTSFTSETVNNITIAADGQNGSGFLRTFIGAEETREDYYWIRTNSVSWDLSTVANGKSIFHVGLASKAFTYDNKATVLTVHDSGLQSTYFLMTMREALDQVIIAKAFYGVAGGVRKGSNLSAVSNIVEGQYSIACTRVSRFLSDAKREHQIAALNFNMCPEALQSVQLGPTLVIGGGVITGFDRLSQELGFHLYPENITLGTPGTSSGAMGDGYRSYRAVYSWTDRNGDVYYSAPSEAIGRTYTGGTNTQDDSLQAPYLNQSDVNNKTDGTTGKIDIYRTVAGGSTFFLVAEDVNPNNAGLDELNTTDIGDETDEEISNNEILYTTGGVLPNIGPPASNILAVNKSRVFLVPMDDPEAVWFSKEKVEGIGIEFAEELQIRVGRGGPNTALATLDDKLIIFKEREMHYISGEGPNDLGQGAFSPVRPISADVGCVEASSVVNIGVGIMFKSHKGIYMVDRSLQVSYIGAPVEKWNNWNIKSAELLDEVNQVRFLLSGGQGVLVYDYLHGQWSHFTNHAGVDAVVHQGKYHYLLPNGRVRKENDTFKDVNFNIPMKVKTNWANLQGLLQGFQRIKRASIIGTYRSPHKMTVKIYTNFDDYNVKQTVEFESSQIHSGNEPLEYEIHLNAAVQKCQSIMFEIYDSEQKGILESYTLNKIALVAGVKKGLNKKSAIKRK